MCRLASFVVTRERVYWHPSDDSHEAIIRHYKLNDGVRTDLVRVEMVPPDMNYSRPLAEWEFFVDQPTTPEWFSKTTEEAMVRDELPKWRVERQFFFDAMDFVATIKGTPWFSCEGSPDSSWKVFPSRTAAEDAAWAAARYAARTAARDAAWAAARYAAEDAARTAAEDAARTAARDAAWAAAWYAAEDAALLSRCIVVADRIEAKHLEHARARWAVWKSGYGLLCDVDGVLYVYRKP